MVNVVFVAPPMLVKGPPPGTNLPLHGRRRCATRGGGEADTCGSVGHGLTDRIGVNRRRIASRRRCRRRRKCCCGRSCSSSGSGSGRGGRGCSGSSSCRSGTWTSDHEGPSRYYVSTTLTIGTFRRRNGKVISARLSSPGRCTSIRRRDGQGRAYVRSRHRQRIGSEARGRSDGRCSSVGKAQREGARIVVSASRYCRRVSGGTPRAHGYARRT